MPIHGAQGKDGESPEKPGLLGGHSAMTFSSLTTQIILWFFNYMIHYINLSIGFP